MAENLPFTQDQLSSITFRISLENNAMLRIILNNQIQIMEKLGMSIDYPKSIVGDLMPGNSNDTYISAFLDLSDMIAELLQNRAWEWAQLNKS